MTASKRLKVIVKHGVGVDSIDIEVAKKLGLTILITHKANYESVAEHTVGLIFALAKKITFVDYDMKTNKSWSLSPLDEYNLGELNQKNLGIIGMGRIGSRVCELLSPLRMNMLIYDPYLSPEYLPEQVKYINSLKDLLKNSDIISIHCPSTDDTHHMIGERELNWMKPNAYLINTARGAIVDERALTKVLKKGLLGGVALDVFEKEPFQFDNDILGFNNVIVSPHIAGITNESFSRMGYQAVEMIINFLEGKKEEIEMDAYIIK